MLITMDSKFAAAALRGRNWMAELLKSCGLVEAKAQLQSKRAEFHSGHVGEHLDAEHDGYLYGADEAISDHLSAEGTE
jgi:hypothetical protein